jgi:predicted acetyltransferase
MKSCYFISEAKTIGLHKVLVTTDMANVASQKVIEANGGLREHVEKATPHIYYWFSLF